MKKHYLAFIFSLFASISLAGSFDASNLVKVDANNTSACVEYYRYKGSIYCSTKALQSSSIEPTLKDDEKQVIVFDDRPWIIAWGKKTDSITTIEYVPMGDNINNWHELVTSQFISDLPDDFSLSTYANNVKQNLLSSGFQVNFQILQEDKKQIIFEFRISSPKNQQQDEIQKVIRTSDGIFILHYVIKKPDMGEANRKKWLSNLMQSSITN